MKRFKKVFCFIMTISMVLSLFSVPVFASSYQTASGTAYMSYFNCDTGNFAWWSLANITDDPVDVTITFYNYDGTLITDDGSRSTGLFKCPTDAAVTVTNYSDSNSDSSIAFTLGAHDLCSFTMGNDYLYSKRGYGVIQWTQENSSVANALIGWSLLVRANPYDRTTMAINNGMPF